MESEPKEGARVLIVDDNASNIGVLYNYLDQAGFTALVCEDGETAVALAERESPDIILLDIMMPGIDGYETCRRIKASPRGRDIPIVFMTALSDVADKIEAFRTGGVDYVTKPFQREEVLERIKTHLTIKRQRDQLKELNDALREAISSKDRFFSIIAHDLRGPFTALLGTADFMGNKMAATGDPEAIEMAALFKTTVESVYNLLENLLEWSRLQRNVLKAAPEPVSVAREAAAGFGLLKTAAANKGQSFVLDIPECCTAYADRNMLGTVIRNLAGNAVKFTPRGGTVTVSAGERQDRVVVEVRDTGVGLSAEAVEELLRSGASESRRGTEGEKGSGLGLLLVKDFVEKMGGTLAVESTEGKGSIFRFDLPKIGSS